MGNLTIRLKRVIELTGGTVERDDAGNAIMTGGNIGLNYFKCFDDDYRKRLVGIIIDHYWNRDIGQETIQKFQLAVQRTMNLNMPYFNKLYESERLEFDPLQTIDMRTLTSNQSEQAQNTEGASQAATQNATGSRTVSSELPQTMLAGDEDYATAATDATGQTNATSNSTENGSSNATGSESGESSVQGYQASPSSLIQDYRSQLIIIDQMVLDSLADCFMLVFNTGDDYSEGAFSAW